MKETYTLTDLPLIRGCFLVELDEKDAGLRLTDRTAVDDRRFDFFVEKRIVQLTVIGGNRKQRTALADAGFSEHHWQLVGVHSMPSAFFTAEEILRKLNGEKSSHTFSTGVAFAGDRSPRFYRRMTLAEMDRLFEYYKQRQYK